MSQMLPAYPVEETNSLCSIFSFHSSPFLLSALPIRPPSRESDLLARLRAPPNSPAYPHEQKHISRSYHTPFPVIKHRFYLHLSTRLYTLASVVTLISNVYVVVKSFYFSMFQLLFIVCASICLACELLCSIKSLSLSTNHLNWW